MDIRRESRYWGIGVVICLFLIVGVMPAWGGTTADIAKQMALGQFDTAREMLVTASDGAAVDELRGLLAEYDALLAERREATQEEYHSHYEKMIDAVELAKWREHVLEASYNYSLENLDKDDFEDDWREKTQDEWVKALGELTVASNLSQRIDWPDSVGGELKQSLIDKGLEIANFYENRHEWLESYGKAYYYLTALKNKSTEYDEHVDVLLRKAAVAGMYAPDPNQEVVSWQERREGVSFEIIYAGLNIAEVLYVQPPNFREMTLLGLRNCRILAETPSLETAFETLKNEPLRDGYLSQLAVIRDDISGMSAVGFSKLQLLEVFQRLLQLNKQTLNFPEEVILAEFTEGAFSGLDDYTYLVWPGDVAEFNKDMTNEFFGVGVVIGKEQGLLKVDSLLEDAPAMRAGLDAGDFILKVDGKSTKTMSLPAAVRRITGPENTDVTLTIDREGFDEPRDFVITRQKIVVQTIKGLYREENGEWSYYVDPNEQIGYVRVTNFAGETTGHLLEVLQELKGQGLRGLILDLRDNTGGYLSAAVEMVNDFVSATDKPIVSTKSPRYPNQGHADYAVAANTVDDTMPLVVLVNSVSASASEIVSGSLRDHHRALLVGTRTFGKGNVQQIQELRPSTAQLKITMAYYYLPSGRRVHRNPKDKASEDYGVEPHVKFELTGKQLEKLYEKRREAGVLYLNKEQAADEMHALYDEEDMLESDPQLRMGLLCMKAQLLARKLGVEDFDFPASQVNEAIAANVGFE